MDLSQVAKTIDGPGYTYVQLDCVGKRIGRIALLEEYEHLREINLSKNRIEDVSPLTKLGYVLKLNLASNRIESISDWGASTLRHLLFLDLSDNRLKALPKLHMPALKQANFARNCIETCTDFRGHSRLEKLDLSGNRHLDCLNGIRDMPLLQTLNVSENSLPGLGGVRTLPALKTLNLAKNSFESLEGPWEEMASLQALDASGNRISAAKEFEPLSRLPELRRIEVAGNPLEEQEGVNIRHEVIICHRRMEFINGEEVTEEEREEARALYEQRIAEERERQRLEEEAKREQEEAAAAAAAAAAAEAEA